MTPSEKLILSPDVDGVTSAVIVSNYVQHIYGIPTYVIGTYNGSVVVTASSTCTVDEVRLALWLDLDVRFPTVKFAIGRRLLDSRGTAVKDCFNPNVC